VDTLPPKKKQKVTMQKKNAAKAQPKLTQSTIKGLKKLSPGNDFQM
jgi:hypothetical protein